MKTLLKTLSSSLFLIFLIHLKIVIGYNLDIKHAIIKRNIQQKEKPNYFGASVAAHRNNKNNSTWILVGAPGYDDPLNRVPDTNYGGIFKCNFQETECTYINLYLKSSAFLGDHTYYFNFSKQWLGITVQSLSFYPSLSSSVNNVLICGHLTQANYSRPKYVVGDCVIISEDLIIKEPELKNFLPLAKLVKLSEKHNTPIFGFSSAVRNDGRGYIIGSPGFFMAKGTSFVYRKVFDNFDSTEEDHWIETFGPEMVTSTESSVADLCKHARDNNIYKSENSGYSVANGRVFDKNFPMYSLFHNNSTNISSSSLTAVVEGGPGVPVSERFDKSDCPDILFNDLPTGGTVRLYAIGVSSGELETKNQRKLVQTLRESTVGARFGHSVALVDVNGDGFDDLIVGAPYFWEDKTYDVANKKLRWLGAVFVYINSKRDPYFDNSTRIKLQPAVCLRDCGSAAFGFSLTKLGDVNMDGLQDFVVSAPFLSKGGALFLYHGSHLFNAHAQPVQVLDSMTLALASDQISRSFGWTLSGQADIDNNGYPDLLVGAPLGGQVALLRAKPLIILEPVMKTLPSQLPMDTSRGFTIDVHFTFKPKDGLNKVVSYPVEIELVVDPVLKRFTFDSNIISRVLKHNMTASKYNIHTKIVKSFDVYWVKDSNPVDLMSPIEIHMEYNLNDAGMLLNSFAQQDNPKPLQATEERSAGKRGLFQKSLLFQTGCQNPSQCLCDVSLDLIRSSLSKRERTVDGLEYELRIGAQSAEVESFVMDYSVKNLGPEACHQAYFNITFSKVLNYKIEASPSSCFGIGNDDSDNEAEIVRCWLNNPLLPHKQRPILSFTFNLSDQFSWQHRSIFLNASVTTVSKTVARKSVDIKALVTIVTNMSLSLVKAPFDTVYGHALRNTANPIRGFNFLESEENIGPQVEFRFSLKNKAKGFLPESFLTLWWPFETLPTGGSQRGKFLLYMVHRPRKVQMVSEKNSEKKHMIEITCDEVALKTLHNPIKEEFGFPMRGLPYSPSTDIEETAVNIDTSKFEQLWSSNEDLKPTKSCLPNRHNQTFTYTCAGKANARCVPIVCRLGPVALSNHDLVIDVKARLYEFTFLEENQYCQRVRVVPLVQWSIPENYQDHIIIPVGQNVLEIPIELNNVIPAKKAQPKHFWLIILGSIVGGLIIMALIVWMLIKCRFFQRQKLKRSTPAKQKWEMYAEDDQDGYYE